MATKKTKGKWIVKLLKAAVTAIDIMPDDRECLFQIEYYT